MTTIPASVIVDVSPNVVSAGGNALDTIDLMLTNSTRIPVGTVKSFPDAASMTSFFGGGSAEAAIGPNYFNGFDNSSVKPGSLLMVQYNASAVSAYLQGGNTAGITLAQLQALTGTLNVVIDGYAFNATSFNLSAATSFSNAAALIQTALNAVQPTTASFTASITTTNMTVTAKASGNLAPGQTVVGGGVTAGTKIVSQTSGAVGGIGVYVISNSLTVSSEAMTSVATLPVVSFDSVSGGFVITSGITGAPSTLAFATGGLAAPLLLTSATGAVLSQGAAAASPATFMNAVVNQTQNFVTFMTLFDPDGGSGNAVKLAFSAWANSVGNRYGYVCWDTDVTPLATVPATGSLGYLIAQASYSGTFLMSAPDATYAAFVCGAAASINFSATNGRTDFDGLSQSGLIATVTTALARSNLLGNGYNFYGAFGTANQNFVFLNDGSVSGPFNWFDSFINQIWLNNAFQLAGMVYKTQTLSIPFNAAGYAGVAQAFADPINAGLNFGAFRAGVPLSASQIAAVNAAAGTDIATTLATRGWYLQVVPASPQVRAARGPLQVNFWYMDGESVQSIDLTSILVQ